MQEKTRSPKLPAITSLIPTSIEGVYRFLWSADPALSSDEAEARAQAYVKKFAQGVWDDAGG